MDFFARTDIHAARRFVQDQQSDVRAEPTRNHRLLLIAARKFRDPVSYAWRLDCQLLDQFLCSSLHLSEGKKGKAGCDPQIAERGYINIEAHGMIRHQALRPALFGDQGDPCLHCRQFPVDRQGFSVQFHTAKLRLIHPEGQARNLCAPRAHKPAQGQDLAAEHVKADVPDRAAVPQIARRKQRRAGAVDMRHPPGFAGLDVVSDNGADKSSFVKIASRRARHDFSIAKHSNAIAKIQYFIEPMRHIENGDAIRRQIAHECEMTGVSRTLVREALRQLESEGLVEVIPHKGPVVTTITPQQAVGIYQVREELEGLAAELFATKASPADRQALRRALDEVRIAYEGGDVLTRLAAKKHFYDCLIKGSGNEALGASLHLLNARAMVLRGRSLQIPSRWKANLIELEALLAALEARNPAESRTCAITHVRQAAKAALESLTANSPLRAGVDAVVSETA